jgi:hypothetical protein
MCASGVCANSTCAGTLAGQLSLRARRRLYTVGAPVDATGQLATAVFHLTRP